MAAKEILHSKEFQTKEELIKWANSKKGTEYIISIITEPGLNPCHVTWTIFYIK